MSLSFFFLYANVETIFYIVRVSVNGMNRNKGQYNNIVIKNSTPFLSKTFFKWVWKFIRH